MGSRHLRVRLMLSTLSPLLGPTNTLFTLNSNKTLRMCNLPKDNSTDSSLTDLGVYLSWEVKVRSPVNYLYMHKYFNITAIKVQWAFYGCHFYSHKIRSAIQH